MTVTTSELQLNLRKYLNLAETQDIYITENGRNIAKLTTPFVDKIALLDSLVGILPADMDVEKEKEERLGRQ